MSMYSFYSLLEDDGFPGFGEMTDSEFRSLREKWEHRHEESEPMTVEQKCALFLAMLALVVIAVCLFLP